MNGVIKFNLSQEAFLWIMKRIQINPIDQAHAVIEESVKMIESGEYEAVKAHAENFYKKVSV